MGFEILSKEGCTYCDHAETLCKELGLDYKKTTVSKDELSEKCGKFVTNYPQILLDGTLIGSFFDFPWLHRFRCCCNLLGTWEPWC